MPEIRFIGESALIGHATSWQQKVREAESLLDIEKAFAIAGLVPYPQKRPGDLQRLGLIGNAEVVAADRFDGVDYELYRALDDERAAVRVFDADSGEPVSMVAYPTLEKAREKYQEMVQVNGGDDKGEAPEPGTRW